MWSRIQRRTALCLRRAREPSQNTRIKQEQDRGACTGSNRDIHWQAPAPGGRDGELDGLAAPVLDNRNSSNAAGTAASAASKVSDNKFIYLYYYVLIV